MEEREYRYAAFISYRHIEPDMTAAKRLHTLIENYTVPRAVSGADGKRKLGRVFRDQEELMLSGDLGGDIRKALEDSEWLIVICTPALLKSDWCMKEIDTFLELGRRDRILTVLADGTPQESIPRRLRFIETEGQTVEKEPLAANIVADSRSGMLKKLKSESLRIFAPMLGVTYDDLKRRERERRLRRVASASLASLVLLGGFLAYAVTQNRIITAQKNGALVSQSLYLADASSNALDSGDKMLALLLALEALPENTAEPERPVVDSAVAALYSALISGSGDNSYESVTELTIPGLTSWRADGSTLMFFSPEQEGYIGSVNLFTGELAETSSALDELPVDVCFSFGLTPYAIYDREVMFSPGGYYSNGEYRSLGELPERDFVKSPWLGVEASDGSICFYNENYGVLQCAGYLSLYCTYESDAAYFEDMKPVNGSEEEYLIATGAESPYPQIIRVDAGVTWAESVLSRYYVDFSMADPRIKGLSGYVSDIDMSKNGDIIAGYNESCIFFWNAADGKTVGALEAAALSGELDAAANGVFESSSMLPESRIVKLAFSPGADGQMAILTNGGLVYLYDCLGREDALKLDTGAAAAAVKDMQWNSDGSCLLLTCGNGTARIVSVLTGETLHTLSGDFELEKASYAYTDFYGNAVKDDCILLCGGDTVKIFRLGSRDSGIITRLSCKPVNTNRQFEKTVALSGDGKMLWYVRPDGLYAVDCDKNEEIRFCEDTNSSDDELAVLGERVISYNTWKAADGGLRVYDANSTELLAELVPSFFSEWTTVSGEQPDSPKLAVSEISFSEDESKMLVCCTRSSIGTDEQRALCVYDTDTLRELWHCELPAYSEDSDRLFASAADWKGFIRWSACFADDGGKLLVRYIYEDSGYYTGTAAMVHHDVYPSRSVFELRDAGTGEVIALYTAPFIVEDGRLYIEPESGVIIAADCDKTVHILDLHTGEQLASLECASYLQDFIMLDGGVAFTTEQEGTDGVRSVGYRLNFDGSSAEIPAAEVTNEPEPDGVFGGTEFFAHSDGLYSAAGEALVNWPDGRYSYALCWGDGDKLLLVAPLGDRTAAVYGGELVILHCRSLAELEDAALRILDGRTLTDEEQRAYFLVE